MLRGRAFVSAGRTTEAQSDLTRALRRLDSRQASLKAAALAWRGRARMSYGDTDKALTDLRAAARLAPGMTRWQAWLGTVLLRRGSGREALVHLQAALKTPAGGFTEALLERGAFFAREGRLDLACEDFRTAYLFDPKSDAVRQAQASIPSSAPRRRA
jgi:tetratricopeptide (TPR) repeat protein